MKPIALKVDNLTKLYRIGSLEARPKTLVESFLKTVSAPIRNFKNLYALTHFEDNKKDILKALDGVSFEIEKGDVVGIIGRNGAGKSTLLKILSRITSPTKGYAHIYGKMASLLEVGTGFHPELTGRENIFLNGAFLGMSKAKILEKFEKIVEFSGIELFLDTPVKRYSSGMYVRLAFAVAAHLDPDILLVDEVLAVGDTQFQKKCLDKIQDVSQTSGRTVIFVSHNMGTIANLCNKVLYLKEGKVVAYGPTDEVISLYLKNSLVSNQAQFSSKSTKNIHFTKLSITDSNGELSNQLDLRFPFTIHIHYHCPIPQRNIELSLRIHQSDGTPVFTSLQSELSPDMLNYTRHGERKASLPILGNFLSPGEYYVSIYAHEPFGPILDEQKHCLKFTIHDTGCGITRYKDYSNLGCILVHLQWEDHHQSFSHEG